MLLFLTSFLLVIEADAFWLPFKQNSEQKSSQEAEHWKFDHAGTPFEVASLAVPRAALSGAAHPTSWCGKAAIQAKKKCDLLVENERMYLATMVANCHLETMHQAPIYWDPTHALRDATPDHQSLVIIVANQLETTCSKFGVSWSQAMAMEQGERLSKIQGHLAQLQDIQEHLSELRSTAKTIVDSTAESVTTAEKMETFSTKLGDVQSAVLKQTKNVETLSTKLSEQLELVGDAESKAIELYLASEERFRAFGTSLTDSMESLPDAADKFLKNSERFEGLLKEQSRLAELQGTPATTTSILLVTLVVSVGFLYSGRQYFLMGLAVTITILKLVAESEENSQGVPPLSFLDPFVVFSRLGCFFLSLIPYQALSLALTLAVAWDFSPATVQKSFLGDREMLATARADAAESKVSERRVRAKAKELQENLTALERNSLKLSKDIESLQEKIATKDNIIRSLQEQLNNARNMQREADANIGTAQNRTRRTNLLVTEQATELNKAREELKRADDELRRIRADAKDQDAVIAEQDALIAEYKKADATESQALSQIGEMVDQQQVGQQQAPTVELEGLRAELEKKTAELATKDQQIASTRALQLQATADARRHNEIVHNLQMNLNRATEKETQAALELQNFKTRLERNSKPRNAIPRLSSFRKTGGPAAPASQGTTPAKQGGEGRATRSHAVRATAHDEADGDNQGSAAQDSINAAPATEQSDNGEASKRGSFANAKKCSTTNSSTPRRSTPKRPQNTADLLPTGVNEGVYFRTPESSPIARGSGGKTFPENGQGSSYRSRLRSQTPKKQP